MVFTRNRHDAAAISADNAAGKQVPSGTPSVSSEVPIPQGPTFFTTLYRSKFIFFDLYVIPQGRNSLGGGAARPGPGRRRRSFARYLLLN